MFSQKIFPPSYFQSDRVIDSVTKYNNEAEHKVTNPRVDPLIRNHRSLYSQRSNESRFLDYSNTIRDRRVYSDQNDGRMNHSSHQYHIERGWNGDTNRLGERRRFIEDRFDMMMEYQYNEEENAERGMIGHAEEEAWNIQSTTNDRDENTERSQNDIEESERYEECDGLVFLISRRTNPSDLLRILCTPIDESIVNHGLPIGPPSRNLGYTYSYLINSASIPHIDYSSDSLSPWTSSTRKAQCRSLGKCILHGDQSITMNQEGDYEVRFTRMKHACGIIKTIIKVTDAKTTTGFVLISYHIETIVDDHSLEMRGRKVYHQMKAIEKPRSNRGPVPAIDYEKIMRHLTDRDNIPFNVSIGNDHDIYLFQSKLMRENFYESLVDERNLMKSILQCDRAIESGREDDINSIHDMTKVEKGVMQVDVTFSVCEGYYLIIIGIYSHSMRTRSSGKQALIPVCLVLSRRHSRDVFRQIGLYLDTLLSSNGKGDLRMRSLMSDKEGSFSGLLEFPFSQRALPLDCHVHLLTNMITAGFDEEEVSTVKRILFGVKDEFHIGNGGILNEFNEEEYEKGINDLSTVSERMQAWIRKRSKRMWDRMSLPRRMLGGIGIRLPSNQALECYNNIVKSESAPGRRNLSEAFTFVLNELKVIDGHIRSSFQGGGLLMADQSVVSSLPHSLSEEESFIPEILIPVPRGSGRVKFEKDVRKWKTNRIEESPIILENTIGDIVGVAIEERGKPRCGSPLCKLPGRSLICEHIAAIVLLGRKDVEEFLIQSRNDAPIHKLINVNVKKGQKPGYRRRVPRRGNNPSPILGLRINEVNEENDEIEPVSQEQMEENSDDESIESIQVANKKRKADVNDDDEGRYIRERSSEVDCSFQPLSASEDITLFDGESLDLHSEMRQKSKQYRMKREEDHQNELARIRALGDSSICEIDEVEIREKSDKCGEGIDMDDAAVVEGEYLVISEEIEIGEVDEIENINGETPILGNDTYSTRSFHFRAPSEEWRSEWRDALGITRVDASSFIPSHSEHVFRVDEAPQDVMYTQNGDVYGAISIWLSGSEISRENVRIKIEEYKVLNEAVLFLPGDESEYATILRIFSIMARVDCMIFEEMEWTRISEGSRIDSRCNLLYFSVQSSRIYPVMGVNKRDKKIRGVTGWFPANVTLSSARKSRRSDQNRASHGKKEMEIDSMINSQKSRSIDEQEGTKDVAEIVLACDALRVRSRKCGGCALNLSATDYDKVLLSYTRKKNSKLFHLTCFERAFPRSKIDSPVVISPFVMRACSADEISEIKKIFKSV